MTALFSLVPAVYRWVALLLLVVALFGYGYYKGRVAGEVRLEAFVAKVEAEGAAALARAAEKARKQQEITNGIVEAWNRSSADVARHYDQRVRDAYNRGRSVPRPSESTLVPHVPTPQSLPDTELREAINRLEVEISELEKRAALDAAQLLALQDWIRQQGM
jgi:hypothetical protein